MIIKMTMYKKLAALCLILFMCSANLPVVNAAGGGSFNILARDSFAEYKMPDGKPPADGLRFKNYPTANESNVNGGFGWGSPWGSNYNDFKPNFTNDLPTFLNVGTAAGNIMICYTYANCMYRKLGIGIPLTMDDVLQVRFDLAVQSPAYGNAVGVGLLGDKVRLGLSSSEADKAPNYISIYTNQTVTKGTNVIPQGNTFYTYVGEITINASGVDHIKLKAFQMGTNEPEEWDVEADFELGGTSIDSIGLLSNAYACLWSNVSLASKNLALGKEVFSEDRNGALVNIVDGNTGTTASTTGFSLDLGGSYKIEGLGLVMASAGQGGFEIYGSNDDSMSDKVLLGKQDEALVGTVWSFVPGNTSAFRYIHFVGSGVVYSIAEMSVRGSAAGSDLGSPVFLNQDLFRIMERSYVPISYERFYLKFSEALDTSTINGAVTLNRASGGQSPLSVSYDAEKSSIVINLREALSKDEEYTLSIKPQIKSASGKTLASQYSRNFIAKQLIETSSDYTIGQDGANVNACITNNSQDNVTVILVAAGKRGKNLESVISSEKTTVPKGSSKNVSVDIAGALPGDTVETFFISDWASLSPVGAKNTLSDKIVIDSVETNQDKVTVTGKVSSAAGFPLNGRDVIVAITKLNQTLPKDTGDNTSNIAAIVNADTSLVNGEGVFVAQAVMSQGLGSGMYQVYAGTNYATTVAEHGFFYIPKEREQAIINAFNQVGAGGDTAAMTTLIKDNAWELGIDIDAKSAGISDFSKVSARMMGQSFATAEAIMSRLLDALATERVNQSTSAQALGEALIAGAPDLSLTLERFNALEKASGSLPEGTGFIDQLWADMFAYISKTPFTDSIALKLQFNRLLDKQLQNCNPIDQPKIVTQDLSLNVGQAVDIPLSSKNAITFNSISVQVQYDKSRFTLNGVEKAPAISGADVNIQEGIVSIALAEAAQKNVYSLVDGRLLTCNLQPTVNGAISSKVDITVVVTRYDAALDVDRAFYFNLTSNINITQKNASNTPTRSSGGVDWPTTSTLPVPTPAATDEPDMFTDLAEVEWAKQAINFLAKNGVLQGTGDGVYAPNQSVKREEFVKMLCLAFKIDSNGVKCEFTDVDENQWYYPYVASASENRIVLGYENGAFGLGENITREQMAVFAYRTLTHFAPKVVFEQKLEFFDNDEISQWARDAVGALVYCGVMKGGGNNKFAPKENATRAMAAQVLYNMLKLFDSSII